MADWQMLERIFELRHNAREAHKVGKGRRPNESNPLHVTQPTMPTYQVDTSLDWDTFAKLADRFSIKAQYQDRQDISQDIISRLAELANRKPNKELTEASIYRIASYVVMEYWRDLKRQPSLASLNEQTEDSEGNLVDVYQTLADDKGIDLDAWLDAKTWLKGCPRRLVKIATKRADGTLLDHKEQLYLLRYRQKDLVKRQKALPL